MTGARTLAACPARAPPCPGRTARRGGARIRATGDEPIRPLHSAVRAKAPYATKSYHLLPGTVPLGGAPHAPRHGYPATMAATITTSVTENGSVTATDGVGKTRGDGMSLSVELVHIVDDVQQGLYVRPVALPPMQICLAD